MSSEGVWDRQSMEQEDINRFATDVVNPEPLVTLLKGHLWLERMLDDILTEVLPFPEYLDLDNLRASVKLSLAAAHGFIRPDDMPAYTRLNKLRNHAAHYLDRGPSAKDVADLRSGFGVRLRELWDQINREQPVVKGWGNDLQECLLILVMSLSLDLKNYRRGEPRPRN